MELCTFDFSSYFSEICCSGDGFNFIKNTGKTTPEEIYK